VGRSALGDQRGVVVGRCQIYLLPRTRHRVPTQDPARALNDVLRP
jgi:hypothetical protein